MLTFPTLYQKIVFISVEGLLRSLEDLFHGSTGIIHRVGIIRVRDHELKKLNVVFKML